MKDRQIFRCPGHPNSKLFYARRLRAHQYACYRAATPQHVAALMRRLYALGMAGDVGAAREYLNRACGKPRRHEDDHRALPPPSALCVIFHDQQPGPRDNGHRDLVEGSAAELDAGG